MLYKRTKQGAIVDTHRFICDRFFSKLIFYQRAETKIKIYYPPSPRKHVQRNMKTGIEDIRPGSWKGSEAYERPASNLKVLESASDFRRGEFFNHVNQTIVSNLKEIYICLIFFSADSFLIYYAKYTKYQIWTKIGGMGAEVSEGSQSHNLLST